MPYLAARVPLSWDVITSTKKLKRSTGIAHPRYSSSGSAASVNSGTPFFTPNARTSRIRLLTHCGRLSLSQLHSHVFEEGDVVPTTRMVAITFGTPASENVKVPP